MTLNLELTNTSPIFSRRDDSGDNFVVLLKMVKCALSICHSNADVERLFSTNKRMLTKVKYGLKWGEYYWTLN